MNRLILTVGISASGKSTYAEYYGTANSGGIDILLSSDRLRGIYGKDDSDQTVSGSVFTTMRAMTRYFLKYFDGKNIIIDATSPTRARRKEFFDIAKDIGNCKTACWCFPITRVFAKERNDKRDRKVPHFVIDRQFDQMEWPEVGEADDIVWVTDRSNHA